MLFLQGFLTERFAMIRGCGYEYLVRNEYGIGIQHLLKNLDTGTIGYGISNIYNFTKSNENILN